MFKSFALTIRPKDGLTDRQADALITFGKKHDYHLIGLEKEGTERHAHLGIFQEKPRAKCNVENRLLSMPAFQSLSPQEVKVFRKGTKIMYNSDYIMGYIGNPDKEDDYYELSRHLPDDIDDLEPYYPPPGDTSAKRPVSIWYTTRASGYEGPKPATESSVLSYIKRLMFVDLSIEIIADQRVLQQKVRALVALINADDSPTYLDPNRSTDEEHRRELKTRCGACKRKFYDALSDEVH